MIMGNDVTWKKFTHKNIPKALFYQDIHHVQQERKKMW